MQIDCKVICFADNIWQIALFESAPYLSRVFTPPWMHWNVYSSYRSFSHINKSDGIHFLFDWIAWPREIELNNFEIWIVETISISGKTNVINIQTKNNQLNANGFTFLIANFLCVSQTIEFIRWNVWMELLFFLSLGLNGAHRVYRSNSKNVKL